MSGSSTAAGILVACALVAAGKEPFHVVREGETVTGLARHYYGSSWKATYILGRNRIESGEKLAAGMRVVIPTSWTYTVRRGDTLAKIAKKYLGPMERYRVLGRENGMKDGQDLVVGQELLMPFHITYTVRKGDTYGDLAKRFYRTTRKAGTLQEYNAGKNTLEAGSKLTIPIFDRATLEARTRPPPPPPSSGDSASAHSDEPELVEPEPAPAFDPARLKEALHAYTEGEFLSAEETLEALLDGDPPPDARPTLLRTLAFCAVARGDRSAAEDYFRAWLALEPKAALDPVQTSPKILEVFRAVSGRDRRAAADGG